VADSLLPTPLGVDTSIKPSGDVGSELLDAPSFGDEIPSVSQEAFTQASQGDLLGNGAFNRIMQQMNDKAYDGTSDTWTDPGGNGKATGTRADVVAYARKFLGVNYVWGGASPSGFDCSGLVQYVTSKFGLHLPRISADQARSGKRTSIGNLMPGDLVAWDENGRNNGADHIAFYIGNGMILEAPHTGAQVRIRKLGKNEGAWGVHLDYK
jgi:cell wall-associated NlpC family hydrolase